MNTKPKFYKKTVHDNFYVEELEERLEMTAAAMDPGMVPNDVCWAVVVKF